jgi:hypothetical protein
MWASHHLPNHRRDRVSVLTSCLRNRGFALRHLHVFTPLTTPCAGLMATAQALIAIVKCCQPCLNRRLTDHVFYRQLFRWLGSSTWG